MYLVSRFPVSNRSWNYTYLVSSIQLNWQFEKLFSLVIKITTKDSEINFEIEFTTFPASVVAQLLVVQCWLIWTAGEGEIFLEVIGVNTENNNQTPAQVV